MFNSVPKKEIEQLFEKQELENEKILCEKTHREKQGEREWFGQARVFFRDRNRKAYKIRFIIQFQEIT